MLRIERATAGVTMHKVAIMDALVTS